MTSWSDDFSTDNFSNGVYTLIIGVEGTSFTVAPNNLFISQLLIAEDQHLGPVPLPWEISVGMIASGNAMEVGYATASTAEFVLFAATGGTFAFSTDTTSGQWSLTGPAVNPGDTLGMTIDVQGNVTLLQNGNAVASGQMPSGNLDDINDGVFYPLIVGELNTNLSSWSWGPAGPPPPPPRSLAQWIDPFTTNNLNHYTAIAANTGVLVDGSLYTDSQVGWIDDRAEALTVPASTFVRFYTGETTPTVVLGWADDTLEAFVCSATIENGELTVVASCPGISETLTNSVSLALEPNTMAELNLNFGPNGELEAQVGSTSVHVTADSSFLAQLDSIIASPYLIVG